MPTSTFPQTKKSLLKKLINLDLENSDITRKVCLGILNYVASADAETLKKITFKDLYNCTGRLNETGIIVAIQYLTDYRIALLELKFEFTDGAFTVEISHDDVHSLRETGEFKHPLTGENVIDPESKIVMFFGLGVNGLEVAHNS